MKENKKIKELFIQYFKLGIVGAINTILTYVITYGCY